MIQIRRWSEKAWCHEKKGLIQEKITWRQTKLWLRKNYLKRGDKEISKHINIKGKKNFLKEKKIIKQTKTMVEEELLEKKKQGNSWTHWHQKEESPLGTLIYDFQKLETSLWKKDTQKP